VRRTDQMTGLVVFAGAVAFSATAWRQYAYWGENGPGPGFLPLWLGVAMAGLAALLFAGATRSRAVGAPWLPRGAGRRRLLAVLLATALFVALLDVVGMIFGTALFLAAILRLVERHAWPTALGVAAGAAAVNYLVFTYWLRVPFPVGVLGF